MSPNPQFAADLVTLTEEILNGKLHFLCSESCCNFIEITLSYECSPVNFLFIFKIFFYNTTFKGLLLIFDLNILRGFV